MIIDHRDLYKQEKKRDFDPYQLDLVAPGNKHA